MKIIDCSLLRRLVCLSLWCLLGEGDTVVMAEDERKLTHRQLNQTLTWAVAVVCTFFIVVSVLLEKVLQKVGKVLWDRHKTALLDALEKIKSELVVLGFISLLLTFGQTYILDICIPSNLAHHMLPCNDPAPLKKKDDDNGENHRRLLWFEHRFLSEGEAPPRKCKELLNYDAWKVEGTSDQITFEFEMACRQCYCF